MVIKINSSYLIWSFIKKTPHLEACDNICSCRLVFVTFKFDNITTDKSDYIARVSIKGFIDNDQFRIKKLLIKLLKIN